MCSHACLAPTVNSECSEERTLSVVTILQYLILTIATSLHVSFLHQCQGMKELNQVCYISQKQMEGRKYMKLRDDGNSTTQGHPHAPLPHTSLSYF